MSAITPNPEYWQRVHERAVALGSDGCSKCPDWQLPCCELHDIFWRTGMDMDFNAITKAEANVLFWECMRQRAGSRLSWYSPRSFIRYLGVELGAWWKG